jgi:hypothetical protein
MNHPGGPMTTDPGGDAPIRVDHGRPAEPTGGCDIIHTQPEGRCLLYPDPAPLSPLGTTAVLLAA